MPAQLNLPLPVPLRAPPDFTAEARKELTAALEQARCAVDAAPWDRRKQGYWRVVAPQMSGWLADAEREQFLAVFTPELDRIEGLL